MKVLIHPDYIHLKENIECIPSGNYMTDRVFCDNRNKVELVTLKGESYVIKKFKKPNWFNRFVYTYFRKSKARRAYEHAGTLLNVGIETPKPVAYIEIRKYGLFDTGYFISEYIAFPLLNEVVNLSPEQQQAVKKDFLFFTAHLHQRKIIHKDYNAGNIMFYKGADDNYRFVLIDINRLAVGKNSLHLCMQAFNQLGVQLDQMFTIISQYADIRKCDVVNSLIVLLMNYKHRSRRQRYKRTWKYLKYRFRKYLRHGSV